MTTSKTMRPTSYNIHHDALYKKQTVSVIPSRFEQWTQAMQAQIDENFIREEINRLLPRKLKLGEAFGLRFLVEIAVKSHRQIKNGATIVDLGAFLMFQESDSTVEVMELPVVTGIAELHAPDKWDSKIGYSTAVAAALNRLTHTITKVVKKKLRETDRLEDGIMSYKPPVSSPSII